MYICERVLTIMKPAHLTKLFLLFISQIAVETFDQGRERKQNTQKRIKKKIILSQRETFSILHLALRGLGRLKVLYAVFQNWDPT